MTRRRAIVFLVVPRSVSQRCLVSPHLLSQNMFVFMCQDGARRRPRGSGGALAGISDGIWVPFRAPVADTELSEDNKQPWDISNVLPIYALPKPKWRQVGVMM